MAILIPTLGGAGAARVSIRLAEALGEHGLRVDIVLATRETLLRADIAPVNGLFELGCRRMVTSVRPLRRYLREARPAALLAVGVRANAVAVLAARGLRAEARPRVVVTQHITLSLTEGHLLGRNRFLRLAARLTYPRADAIVAVSNGVADDLALTAGLSRSRIHVLPNAVVSADMIAGANNPVHHAWITDPETPLIAYVGRLQPPKDLETLADAFAQLRGRQPARLMVLGDGLGRSALVQRLAALEVDQDVWAPGFVHNPYPYIRAADVLILPSWIEGMPTVLIEALALGTPVVAADCDHGPRELLGDREWGRLVPPGDASELTSAVEDILARGRPDIPETAWRRYRAQNAAADYLPVLMGEAG